MTWSSIVLPFTSKQQVNRWLKHHRQMLSKPKNSLKSYLEFLQSLLRLNQYLPIFWLTVKPSWTFRNVHWTTIDLQIILMSRCVYNTDYNHCSSRAAVVYSEDVRVSNHIIWAEMRVSESFNLFCKPYQTQISIRAELCTIVCVSEWIFSYFYLCASDSWLK